MKLLAHRGHTIKAIVLLLSIGSCMPSFAATIEQNMKVLSAQLKVLNKTEDVQVASQALLQMQAAAEDAKQTIPPRLSKFAADSVEVQGYQAQLDQLIAVIQSTQALVQEGHLEHAKMEAKKLIDIKAQGHKLYK